MTIFSVCVLLSLRKKQNYIGSLSIEVLLRSTFHFVDYQIKERNRKTCLNLPTEHHKTKYCHNSCIRENLISLLNV